MLFKRIFIVGFAMFLMLAAGAQNNSIKTSLSGLFLGDLGLSYERVLENSNSVQIKFAYLNPAQSLLIGENTFTPVSFILQEYKGGANFSLE